MSTPSEIRAAFLEAIQRGDLSMVLECYRPDAVLVAPEGRFEGREQIESYYRPQLQAFPGTALEVLATFDSAETGIAEWTFTGTHTGLLELPGGETLPATGRAVTQRGVDIAVIAEGGIREHRIYYDNVELLGQLGLLGGGR